MNFWDAYNGCQNINGSERDEFLKKQMEECCCNQSVDMGGYNPYTDTVMNSLSQAIHNMAFAAMQASAFHQTVQPPMPEEDDPNIIDVGYKEIE